ncbi:MAG: hypothetical protein HZA52_02215 [Planctomycetes bacterium]|nr:hypothetical protein [Planctomycetota bacterium]
MTGLAEWTRDARLPAEFGETELAPPTESELVALANEHLFRGAVRAARWSFARWKPRVALCAAYDVEFDDGATGIVVAKRYLGDKARSLAARRREEDRELHEAVLPDERLHLWAFPADRELPGAVRVLELHRTAKVLRELDTLGDWVLRWQSSSVERLRYKPERRAVLRIDWVVREGSKEGPKSRLPMGARCLPLSEIERVLRARAAAERAGLGAFAPRFLGGEARTGTLFEAWLDVAPLARDAFARTAQAGELLARLASLDAVGAPLAHVSRLDGVRDFLELSGPGREVLQRVASPERRVTGWVHGDFHPDQLALDRDGHGRLLDLDALGRGDPADDCASWLADRLAADPSADFDAVARDLCSPAGLAHELDRVRAHTAEELALRAAAALRRLEAGGRARADALCERALELATLRGATA